MMIIRETIQTGALLTDQLRNTQPDKTLFKLNRHKPTRKWVPVQSWRKMARVCLYGVGLCLTALVYEFSDAGLPWQVESPTHTTSDKTLTVATHISPHTYYETQSGPSGFEYTLLALFAQDLGLELVINTTETVEELFAAVSSGQAALASAGLSPTPQRRQEFLFSEPYLESEPIVVYKVGNHRPRNQAGLVGKKLVVVANSSHSAALRKAQKQRPDLQWREVEKVDSTQLLSLLEQGLVDYTILDSAEFVLHQGNFPSLKRAFTFAPTQTFNWMFTQSATSESMRIAANEFLERVQSDGTLAQLEERFFSHSDEVGQVAANEFSKNIYARLPRYKDNIQRVADSYAMDWRLLAAISYQESTWNPRAISPTGVRGMMMLTQPTAREVGVTNRLDIDESLNGGAKYYHQLKDRLPNRITEPDRSWFALAAYNIGMGHLEDARRLTQSLGQDPDSWYHVKETLPLLTQPKWYKKTRYGYARGHESVHYVQRIRHYYSVLVWQDLAPKDQFNLAGDTLVQLLGSDWVADNNNVPTAVAAQPLNNPLANAELSSSKATMNNPATNTLASAADLIGADSLAQQTNSL